MRGEYRKAVTARVESFNHSCEAGTVVSLDTLRLELGNLLPNEKIAADLVSRVYPCEPAAQPPAPVAKVDAPVASPVAASKCLEMPSQQAMARLKSQVSPNLPFERIPSSPVSFRVKVRIDENGNVSVKEIEGSTAYVNEAMRAAIERWKFSPAVVQDQRRCVEAELPVVLKR
jgi:hypothetical protein